MATTIAVHGKNGAFYRQWRNGFKGSGLADMSWGAGFNGASSAYFEVVIDSLGATDTFKWRKNGGSWTTLVPITGAAQTLSDGQTVTFAAITGHTLTDQWSIGHLVNEACTITNNTAQVTDSLKRILNWNAKPVFTDSGGAKVAFVDYTSGAVYFATAPTTVTVSGNNGFILESGLQKEGYVFDWNITMKVDKVDSSAFGDAWKSYLGGLADATGTAKKHYIGNQSFLSSLQDEASGAQNAYLLKLYTYDPAQDGTGDHFVCWAIISGFNPSAQISAIVAEQINFDVCGKPTFIPKP